MPGNTLGAELSVKLPVIPISVIKLNPLNWIMHFMVVLTKHAKSK